MNPRVTEASLRSLLAVAGGLLAIPFGLAAQSAAARPSGFPADWVVPRTVFGHPDLQGDWSFATLTPIQRPAGQGPTISWEQVAVLEGRAEARLDRVSRPSDPDRDAPPAGGDGSGGAAGGVGGYNGVYIDAGDRVAIVNGEPRSSLVTNPSNGRIPPITGAATALRAEERRFESQFDTYDHPELRPLGERCIISFGTVGPPMLPNGFYNNNVTIAQSADHVAIMLEMVHDVRIVKLGERKPLPAHVRLWFGDSWGRWEGNTLVVETTNLHPGQSVQGAPLSETGRVVERFTRVDQGTILYEFTVDDPATFTAPWGGQIPMSALQGDVYEYACHEGNYALSNILSGARYQERMEAETQGGAR